MASKSSLNNVLQSILAVANEEQSAIYPPSIFSTQYNTVTALLLSKLVKEYPGGPMSMDILTPFIKFSMRPVQNGTFTMPDDYRNILGAPYIFVNQNEDGQCGKIPQITTLQQFKVAQLKGGCKCLPITIVSESEFSIRTNSTYKYPTYKNPIGYFSGLNDDGQKIVKICPYDLTKVALLYAKQENMYQYGYIMQPDDTYIFDSSTTVESEWTNAAFDVIFKAMMALFSAYVRDKELSDWSRILTQEGIL